MRVQIDQGAWVEATSVTVQTDRVELANRARHLKPDDRGVEVYIERGTVVASVINKDGRDSGEIAGGEVLAWVS